MSEIIKTATFILNNLHFIRADWFYAFIPLFLYLLLSYKTTRDNKNWSAVIDPQLMPFVLSKTGGKQRRYPLVLVLIAASLCITALAGPVYKKLPQPVYREQSSLVVLLDLSQSMNATDIKTSRLSRAKLELLDLLKTRKTGQTALIVYAADAFVVTPLTDDNATIANLVPALETDMMPAQGSNLSAALAKTFSLLTQAGIVSGDILVITDDIHQRDEDAIKKVASQGHRLSIFGIGTTDGGPIPMNGGFLQDSDGAIVIPKLHPSKLQRYALSGGGLYSSLQADDSDINKLARLFQSSEVSSDTGSKDLHADVWQEEGHWLLLPLIFFAALWARQGWIAAVLLFILPMPSPVYAEQTGTVPDLTAPTITKPANAQNNYFDTEHLWLSPDQKAMKAFNNGDNEKAAREFTRPEWKASAFYRDGNYEAAAKTLEDASSSDSLYNRGNALAKLGKYEEALKAYDKAIEQDKNNEDAIYNREQVKKVLQQQKKSGQDQSDQDQSEQDQSKQDQSEQGDSEQKKDQQKNSEQQDSQQQDAQNQDGGNQDEQSENENQADQNQQPSPKSDSKEQQQAEQEQLKQRDAEAEAKQQEKEQQQYQQDQKNNEKQQADQQQAEQQESEQNRDEVENRETEDKPLEIEVNPVEASITEEEKATEQWLKRIPDDPGGLLRRKFYYQYKQIPNQNDDSEPW